uniref:Uncharacterized protein n=1 Tax=Arundo donax TaxID=35708 RepID=A0A0A9CKB0_ARUDO
MLQIVMEKRVLIELWS